MTGLESHYECGTPRRRQLVRAHATLNGIDFLEVDESIRRRLYVTLFKAPATPLTADQVQIVGGDTVRGLRALTVASSGTTLTVELDRDGDFSNYTFRLVADPSNDDAPAGFDPRLSRIEFSFKAGCATGFDCREPHDCPPERRVEPDVDYQARDFTSFRRLMLDRMRLLAPEWSETSVADVMHALVDLKAYVADYQAYQQDAVGTEAYLHTARRRVSVARHARLLDYRVNEGAAARTWVQLVVASAAGSATLVVPSGTRLLTRAPDALDRITDRATLDAALTAGAEMFETVSEARVNAAHDRMPFHTWGDEECCLPRGATEATLAGDFPLLQPGDVLVLEEVRGPETGATADADLSHRQAVTLIAVERVEDPLTTPATLVTNVRWHPRDALRFPVCVATRKGAPGADAVDPWSAALPVVAPEAVSVARGNIALADHGRTVPGREVPLGILDAAGIPREKVGTVPGRRETGGRGPIPLDYPDGTPVPLRFNPSLAQEPVSRTVRPKADVELPLSQELSDQLDAGNVPRALKRGIEARQVIATPLVVTSHGDVWVARAGSLVYHLVAEADGALHAYLRGAAADLATDAASAEPDIRLRTAHGDAWTLVPSLLASAPDAREFVAETDEGGTVRLRFPAGLEAGTVFNATYRVGGGSAGNVGAEAIRHVVSSDPGLLRVRNPLPAMGGIAPESLEAVRQRAPFAYRTQERAVTAQDYADVAMRHPAVQRAVATFRWTGSWYTVFVNVDPQGGGEVSDTLDRELRALFERYRMAGSDVEIDSPVYVPLELALEVCVRSDHLRTQVDRAVRSALSSREHPDGSRGAFHPDSFTFGQTVYLSRIVTAVQQVAGVESVRVTRFRRRDDPSSLALDTGRLTLGRLEIARLDNDRNYPERGLFALTLIGGR